MKESKLFLVISREFLVRVKKRSFIIMTLLTPLLFAALVSIPSLIMLFSSGEKGREILVVDRSGRVENYFEESEQFVVHLDSKANLSQLKERFPSHLYAVVEIVEEGEELKVTSYSIKQLGLDAKSYVEKRVGRAIRKEKLEHYQIEDLEEIIADLDKPVSLKTIVLSDDGEEKQGMVELYMGISYISSFMIYMFIFMFGSLVMRGVIEEKSSRVVEVIVSSVKPFHLMLGKILGIGAVALLQFLIWIVLTFGIVIGIQTFVGLDKLGGATTEQIVQMGGDELGGEVSELLNVAEMEGPSFMEEIVEGLSSLPVATIVFSFLAYFILGYLLYAALFAAVGSASDSEADTQQLTLPITLPLVIGLFLMIHTFQYPDSSLSLWGSMIPFTSPMVMIARVPFGVPLHQLLLSISILLLTFLLFTYISAKIYRVGILMYGKKITFKELIKWIRY